MSVEMQVILGVLPALAYFVLRAVLIYRRFRRLSRSRRSV